MPERPLSLSSSWLASLLPAHPHPHCPSIPVPFVSWDSIGSPCCLVRFLSSNCCGRLAGSQEHTASRWVREGEAHLYIGTSSWIGAHVSFKKTDLRSQIASVPCAVTGRYLAVALQSSAGSNLSFLCDKIFSIGMSSVGSGLPMPIPFWTELPRPSRPEPGLALHPLALRGTDSGR